MQRTIDTSSYSSNVLDTGKAQGMMKTLAVWQRRIISRHQLARLDSRLLADAGISEAQRSAELSKPFWR
jgi:uncharacterized protein YjiS (DUF1127 family)